MQFFHNLFYTTKNYTARQSDLSFQLNVSRETLIIYYSIK